MPRRTARWRPTAAALGGVALLCAGSPASADHVQEDGGESQAPLDQILVKGQRPSEPDSFVVSPERATPNAPDTAALADLVPGGGVVDNGALAGQVQFRGMYGPRVDVRVDEMFIQPGGPNWMDPPLHYAPRPLLDHFELVRGVAPVSAGAETLGGSARAVLKTSEFGEDDELAFGGDLSLGGRSGDASVSGGGLLSLANARHRMHVIGSAEKGDDLRAGRGKIKPSQYERYSYGAGYGFRIDEHEVGASYRHNDTEDSGNAALPMDTGYVNAELLGADYSGTRGSVGWDLAFSFDDIDHSMNNYKLRPKPANPMAWRKADAESRGAGYAGSIHWGAFQGVLELGTDGHFNSHDMDVSNPNAAAFFLTAFDDSERNRYSAFAEWKRDFAQYWDVELGVRYTRVSMDTGRVDGTPAMLMPPAMALRDAFNAAKRDRSENLVDAVLRLGADVTPELRVVVGAARKTRAPSYLERYGWLPLEITGGLADGRNYVGQIGLDPEVAYEVEAGFDWRWKGVSLSPRAFYRSVDDFIQGELSTDPAVILVSTMVNGDPAPLEFSNVDAELYGFDLAYAFELPIFEAPLALQLDGILSWVRGERRDVNDDLYRIAPLHGRTTLSLQRVSWVVAVESVYAGSQDHVSTTLGESRTDAWGVLNLFASWEFFPNVIAQAGVDNVTDEFYEDHLAGISRVSKGAVSAGDRLPGPGRSFYGRISGRF